jgi:ankyrin repeat protein
MCFGWGRTEEITLNTSRNKDLIKGAALVVLCLTFSVMVQESGSTQPDPVYAPTQSTNEAIDCHSAKPGDNAPPLPEWQGSELHKAIARQDIIGVKKLLTQQANPNEKDNYGNTPLFYAVGPRIGEPKLKPFERKRLDRKRAMRFQLNAVEALLKSGADPNVSGMDRMVIFVRAASGGFGAPHTIEVLKLLLKYEADVNRRDGKGFTALMEASYRGHTEVVQFLLQHGSDARLTNCDGKTAISLAQAFHHADVVRLLQTPQ